MLPDLLLWIVYVPLIVVASYLGGLLPDWFDLGRSRGQRMTAFVGGFMLSVGVLHLLPHSLVETSSVDLTSRGFLAGALFTFALLRVFHTHTHAHPHASAPDQGGCHDHDHDHAHDHGHHHDHASHETVGLTVFKGFDADRPSLVGKGRYSWLGMAIGLSLHTLVDGAVLAAAVAADAHAHVVALYGLAPFLAICLHKPLDALAIASLMAVGGWSPQARMWVNTLFASMCPLGAMLFLGGLNLAGERQVLLLGLGLAFSAGVFVCLALTDLLPELPFAGTDRLWLVSALLAGALAGHLIGFLEPSHTHGEGPHHHHHGAAPPPREVRTTGSRRIPTLSTCGETTASLAFWPVRSA